MFNFIVTSISDQQGKIFFRRKIDIQDEELAMNLFHRRGRETTTLKLFHSSLYRWKFFFLPLFGDIPSIPESPFTLRG